MYQLQQYGTTICLHKFPDICLHKLQWSAYCSREFTHRVKSVSMAKFSAEEVSALQAGGNERARQTYFKAWDAQRLPYPDASNLQRLRDFIKHVYVDRKYNGEKSVDNLPRLRLNDKEESCGSKKGSAYHGGSRSSLSEDRYEGRYSKRSSPVQRSKDGSSKYYYDERRSPRHDQENSRYGGFRRSPARFEVIDDRFRDDECGSRRFPSTDSKIVIRSLGLLKNMERTSSCPVRDNLGDGVPPLEEGKLSKATNAKDTVGSSHNQNIASSSDQCSIDRNPAEHKRRSSGSLIDLSPEGNSLDAEIIIQTPQMLHTDSGSTWPSFEHPAKGMPFQARSAVSFESLLIELSVPSVLPASDSMSEGPSIDDALSTVARGNFPASGTSPSASAQHMSAITINVGTSTTASTTNNMPAEPHDESPPQAAPIGDVDSTIAIADRQQLSNMQQYHPTTSLVSDSSPIMQLTNPPVGTLNNQPWNSSNRPNRQWPLTAYAQQSSQTVSKSAQDAGSGVQSEPLSTETTSIGRKELPADLFTASYSTVTAPVTGQQNETGSPYGMGVSMLCYPNAMRMHAFPNTARSINPFDLNGERIHVQAPPFPSMASLQGALPNVSAASSLFQTSRPDTQSSGLMAPQSPSYASAMRPGASMGIHVQNNMTPSRSQGLSGFGSDGVLGHLNTTQQSTGECSAPSTPNPFSSIGGNPFG